MEQGEQSEQVKSAVVKEVFVRETGGGIYARPEEELVLVLEDGQERTIWLGPQAIGARS